MPGVARRLTVTVNGEPHEFPEGTTVLHAAGAAGHAVPALCHDDRLEPAGACRMCVVSIDGRARPQAACTTALADGMSIRTHTPELERLRRTNLSLIAGRYPAAAVEADPDHPFHELLAAYGLLGACRPAGANESLYEDDTHPYLAIAMDRCIHCYRCVRICRDVQGADVWHVRERGPETRVTTRGERSVLEAGCASCGACSDTCPTGAISDRRESPAESWTPTTCMYCGVGCQMNAGTAGGRVVAVRPAPAAVNRAHLCVKGRYAFEFNHSPDRVTSPMIRRDGAWREVSWSDALDETAARLTAILERDPPAGGPHAIGVLGSARA